MSLMRDKLVYVVGKGSSLDYISKKDFPSQTSPIMCMNDSILTIDGLGLLNPMYVIQNAPILDGACVPKRGMLLVNEIHAHLMPPTAIKGEYSPKEFGRSDLVPGVVFAIDIARHFGAKRFVFLCFDSCMSGSMDYAERFVEAARGSTPKPHGVRRPWLMTHKERIEKATNGMPYEFKEVAGKPQPKSEPGIEPKPGLKIIESKPEPKIEARPNPKSKRKPNQKKVKP